MPSRASIFSHKLVAEGIGTLMITLTAISVDVCYFAGNDIGNISRWVARGCIAAAAIFVFSEISGAHLNPAVTLAFVLRRRMSRQAGAAYIAAQFTGAFAAAGIAGLFFANRLTLGASHPGTGVTPLAATCIEAVLTAVLIVISVIGANEAAIGKDVAPAVGFATTACGLAAGTLSGASMNPARSLAPQILTGQFDLIWIYVAGPLAGTLIGVAIVWWMTGARRQIIAAQAMRGGDDERRVTTRPSRASAP